MMKELKTKIFHEKIAGCTGFEAIKRLARKPFLDEHRYALGEIYYIAGDYDAAFFKWQQIKEPVLVGWSQFHTAAYHMEQRKFGLAEEVLLQIDSAEDIITTEKYLFLAKVYEIQNQKDLLFKTYIKLLNLDLRYENTYELVSNYFESIGHYRELFMTEMSGTDVYNELQLNRVLTCLEKDETGSLPLQQLFEQFIVKLVKQSSSNLSKVLRSVQLYMQKHKVYEIGIEALATSIKKNPKLLGHYFFEEHLKEWIALMDGLYWNATSPETAKKALSYLKSCIQNIVLTLAQKKVVYSYFEEVVSSELAIDMQMSDLEHLANRFYQLTTMHQINEPLYSKFMMEHFLSSEKKVLIAGRFNSGKSSFINSVLNEQILKSDIIPTTSAITVLSHHPKKALVEWKEGKLGANSIEELEKVTTIHHEQSSTLSTSLIFLQAPNEVLKNLNIRLIDTPGFFDTHENTEQNPTFTYLHLADEIVFMFAAEGAFTSNEKMIIEQIIEAASNTPISFVINKVDSLEEEEIEELLEDVERKIYKTFGKKLPLYLYSSEEEDYHREDMKKFLRSEHHISVNQRIKSVFPYLNQYTEEMKLHIAEQQTKQLQVLQESDAEMKRYSIYVAEVKAFCNSFADEIVGSLQTDFLDPVITRFNNTVLEFIRSLADDLSYEKTIGEQIDILNEKMNRVATATFTHHMSELVPSYLMTWQTNTEAKIKQHHSTLHQQTKELTTFNEFIQLPDEQLKGNVHKEIQELKRVQPLPVYFIDKGQYVQKFLNTVGKLFGMQNSQDYIKIDKLKKSLQEDLFQQALERFTFYLKQETDELNKQLKQLLVEMVQRLFVYLDENLKDRTVATNKAAVLYKQLTETKSIKIEEWELLGMKARQLESLFS